MRAALVCASLPPMASFPPLVWNHLNFSYHSLFFRWIGFVPGPFVTVILERRPSSRRADSRSCDDFRASPLA